MKTKLKGRKNPGRPLGGPLSLRTRILPGAIGLLLAILFETGIGMGQQPSTAAAPIFAVNSKYVNGVAPGYWPTKGAGLTLNLGAGSAGLCSSTLENQQVVANYAGGTLLMAPNATNYVYLSPVGPHPPGAPTVTPSTTGGSLAAGTYLVFVTYTNPSGESIPNDINGVSSVTTTGATSSIVVTSPPASLNATGWNVSVSPVNGAAFSETKQNNSPIALGTNFTLTSVASGTANSYLDTSGCAPWSNTTSFGPGQQPLAVVTTNGSAITAIVDSRNWFDSREVADTGGQVFNVMAYGAQGDGVTDDTAAIQAAITSANTWRGGIVYFPAGTYIVTSTLQTAVGSLLFTGTGLQSTLKVQFSGDVIAVNCPHFQMENMEISVNYPSASRGSSAVIAANSDAGYIRNVVVIGTTQNNGIFFRANVTGGVDDNWRFDRVDFPGVTSLWQDLFLLSNSSAVTTLSGTYISNITGNPKVVDAAFDFNGMIDTVLMVSVSMVASVGSTGPVYLVQNTVSAQTEFPRWIECHGCMTEAPGVNAFQVTAGKNIEYSGYVATTNNAFVIGSGVAETNIHDTIFTNLNQSAVTYAGVGGLQVRSNQFDSTGEQTNNTYDTISIAANGQNFQIEGNYWRNSTYNSPNLPRYGINVGTGASNYSIANNLYTGATPFGTAFITDASNTGSTIINTNVGIGTATPALQLQVTKAIGSGVNPVVFSATPTFDAKLGNTQKITLTGNVTSSTLSNAAMGEWATLNICQDATGARKMVFPTTMLRFQTPPAAASGCGSQLGWFDGTNLNAVAPANPVDVRQTAQTAAIASTVITVPDVASHWLVTAHLHVTTADASGQSVTGTLGWTEDGVALSKSTAAVAVASTANFDGLSVPIYTDAGTNVTFSTSVSGAFTTAQYAVNVTAQRR